MRFYPTAIIAFFAFVVAISLTGCIQPNRPHQQLVNTALSFDEEKQYDFGFLEYSEHGNLFNRRIYDELLKHIEIRQKTYSTALVVFVHGWHHNAASTDTNVIAFNKLLSEMAALEIGPFRDHRVVGIYLGWRGSSISVPLLRNLTFWDRKAVASEVGHGGVTEALLTLERVSRCGTRDSKCEQAQNPDNRILILGHSFGGAIVLSALSDVFLGKLVNAEILTEEECENEPGDKDGRWSQKRGAPCARAAQFGHGVVLLNPAIEANQVLPLKEIMASFRYPDTQDVLMHVLSSEGDLATRLAFPVGQWLNNITWSETDLSRTYEYKRENRVDFKQSEGSLTETTVGNYAPFRTAWIGGRGEYQRCWDRDERSACHPGDESQRIPIGANEPIQFYLTDQQFMKNHSDVFNCAVRSYVMAIAAEAVSTEASEHFSFFRHYRKLLGGCEQQ